MRKWMLLLAAMTWVAVGLVVACSGAESAAPATTSAAGGSGAASGGGTSNGASGGGIEFDAGSDDASLNEDSACATQSEEAKLTKKPVDIIFVIDNSGSMGQEITGVQDNINQNFATIIEQSGIDYRVIMVTEHGPLPSESVCIEAPLSTIPQGGCKNPPNQPGNNPPKFFHYDFSQVSSADSWCKLLQRFSIPDDHNFAPGGYSDWLRPEAVKVFVEVTDDNISCSFGGQSFNDGPNNPNMSNVAQAEATANAFDDAMLALSPAQFGNKLARNYIWHSLIALTKNPGNPDGAWQPADAYDFGVCNDNGNAGVAAGLGYQALSKTTGGLRFSLCDPSNYSVVFNKIAEGVIAGATLKCEFAIPDPPPGQEIDPVTIVVEFTPSMGEPVKFEQVAGAAECGPDTFYIEGDLIKLCPDTCKKVEGDEMGKIKVLFGCKGGMN